MSYGPKTEPDLNSKSLSFFSYTCKNVMTFVILKISKFLFFKDFPFVLKTKGFLMYMISSDVQVYVSLRSDKS